MTTAPREPGTEYFVFADYGYTFQKEIYKGSDWHLAQATFNSECEDPLDMDCSLMIELASFSESGEYIVHDSQAAEAKDDGYDEDTKPRIYQDESYDYNA
jgi:hypothetical protein